jgi:DNA-binding MarR family transcriptional regulator
MPRRRSSAPQPDLRARVAAGFLRIGQAARSAAWKTVGARRLTPTQTSALTILARRRPGEMRPSDLAAALGISRPTMTVLLRTLYDKGLVDMRRGADQRAVHLAPTRQGRRLVADRDQAVRQAVGSLTDRQLEQLLAAQLAVIRALDEQGVLAPARICLTCRYFRPRAGNAAAPHHCALLDAPLRTRDLRVDCEDHLPALGTSPA